MRDSSSSHPTPDFQALFESAPGLYYAGLLSQPDCFSPTPKLVGAPAGDMNVAALEKPHQGRLHCLCRLRVSGAHILYGGVDGAMPNQAGGFEVEPHPSILARERPRQTCAL